MYFEKIQGMQNAIDREKQLKRWHREWKWNLIKENNPELNDLASDWYSDDEIKAFKEGMAEHDKGNE